MRKISTNTTMEVLTLMSKTTKILIAIICTIVVVVLIFNAPGITRAVNQWRFDVQTAHDQTDYATLRRVENTARAMISSYHADLLIWENYRNSDIQEQRNWASSARIRANTTASTFNNFILENSFVWAYGVPDDIAVELPVIIGSGDEPGVD